MMTDTCGPTWLMPFAYYDPDTSSVRTSQATFPWDSTPSSPTLPPWGSMRGGELYERPTPAPLTAARDCSSSQLLPTSRATDGDKGGPSQAEIDGGNPYRRLETEIALLPTPAVNDMGRGKTAEQWDEWTAKMQASHSNGNGHGKSLEIEAQRLAEEE